jgi:hypothetical protein
MATDPHAIPSQEQPAASETVQMPRATIAPLALSLGMALMAAGVALSSAFFVVGALIVVGSLGRWISQLLPGQGHVHEPLVMPEQRPKVVAGVPGSVEALHAGKPGYRLRLPEKVHPISAGIKGGIVGGVVMPLPALAYGLLSGHGPWLPVNLLAGMALPGIERMPLAELEQFRPPLFIVAVVIHAVLSVVIGLLYGVLLPTLPPIPAPLAWGGLLMPLLWTAVSFSSMRAVNPVLYRGVDWPWFIACQFLFGVAAALVVIQAEKRYRPLWAGLLGGVAGGILMPVPAVMWSLASGHGLWYPVNLLAGMVLPGIGLMPAQELVRFHPSWLAVGIAIHALMSIAFGLVYGVLLPRLRPIPAPLAWGGLLMPLIWTGSSYGLMGVVNPLLQRRVNWPWFIVSQFVFGVVAAVVVVRSEMVHIPPAGRGPDRAADFLGR